MKKKLGPDAFAFYLGQGPGRSYQAVAERFGASKRAVVFCADREDWQKRIADHDTKLRDRSEKAAAESIESVVEKQLKVLRYIQGKAIEALKTMPIDNAIDAVKAYTLALDKERQVRGSPADQAASRVEQITREEIRTLLTNKPAEDGDDW